MEEWEMKGWMGGEQSLNNDGKGRIDKQKEKQKTAIRKTLLQSVFCGVIMDNVMMTYGPMDIHQG